MELTYDWRSFQSVFYPKRRSLSRQPSEASNSIFLIVEREKVIAAFGEGEDLGEWIGVPYAEVAAEFSHRELIVFERAQVEGWINGALALPHFHDQVEFLRSKATPQIVARNQVRKIRGNPTPLFQKHFLLEALQGWWAKLLPSAFGIFIRLEGEVTEDMFLLIRRGRLETFHKCDLTSLGVDRARDSAEVVKYLAQRYMVPVQGVFVPLREWNDWAETPAVWRKIAMALKADRVKLVPFRWGVVSLLSSRAFLGL